MVPRGLFKHATPVLEVNLKQQLPSVPIPSPVDHPATCNFIVAIPLPSTLKYPFRLFPVALHHAGASWIRLSNLFLFYWVISPHVSVPLREINTPLSLLSTPFAC